MMTGTARVRPVPRQIVNGDMEMSDARLQWTTYAVLRSTGTGRAVVTPTVRPVPSRTRRQGKGYDDDANFGGPPYPGYGRGWPRRRDRPQPHRHAPLPRGIRFRALVRQDDERANALRQLEAEVIRRRPDRPCLDAPRHRRLRAHSFGMSVSPAYLEATVNVAAVARHHGVEAFVNMSQMNSYADELPPRRHPARSTSCTG